MRNFIVTILEALVMIVIVILIWAVMSAFNMGHCIISICRNTPKIVTKAYMNKDRYISVLKSYL